jgi:hypothetical protein
VIERYRRLVERLRTELPDIDREVLRAQKSWETAQVVDDADPFIDSVALNLHGFYSGVERMLELIVSLVDESQPEGSGWHKQLLELATQAVPGVRPAILSTQSAMALDRYRKFRHLVRNVYTSRLVPARMKPLLDALPETWQRVQAELLAFADFANSLSRGDEGPEA